MKCVFTFLITLLFFANTFAQKEKDSLFNVWYNVKLPDSTRFESMSHLIENHYLFTKTDSFKPTNA